MIPKFKFKDDLHVKRYLDESTYNPDTGTSTYYAPSYKISGLVKKNIQTFTYSEYALEFTEKVEQEILIPQKEIIDRQSRIFEVGYKEDDGTVRGIEYEVLTQEFEKNPLNNKIEYTRIGTKVVGDNTLESFQTST